MYNVLVPKYINAGKDFKGNMQYNLEWIVVGQASSIEEAKQFTPYPVLG